MAFDHQHKIWDQLLQQSVKLISNGSASQLDYKLLKSKTAELDSYLSDLSKVTEDEFSSWSKNQQKAFLINSYNAFTVQLILSRYPDLSSIKDLGSFFSSPWKKQFFTLLGKSQSLDNVEHKILRKEGVYNEPYIHFAVVCASIGCPAIRNKAFTADKMEDQLKDSLQRFLSDHSRNRFNAANNQLEVSKIFDWYEDDFSKGYRGIYSLKDLFARYADKLTDDPESQQLIREKKVDIDFLEYDWKLNDI